MGDRRVERWINPKVLRWARERLRMSHKEVEEEAEKLAKQFYEPVTVKELKDWEAGVGEPTLAHLETLAEIYICPVGYFFMETEPEVKLPLSFRGLSEEKENTISSVTLRTLYRFFELANWTVEFLRSTGIEWVVRIQRSEVKPSPDQVDELAVKLRQRLGWTPRKRKELNHDDRKIFDWWRRTLEKLGIFCFEMTLDTKDVRGASLWDEGYPFILVNRQDANAGKLFTLLHEFSHLLSAEEGTVCDFRGLHKGRNPEPFANRLAARILLLPNELADYLKRTNRYTPKEDWSDYLLDRIRKPFGVSRDVVAIYLEELKLAPKGFYERKRKEWEEKRTKFRGRGGRPSKEKQKLRELGYSLTRLLSQATDKPVFPWLEVSLITGMKVEKTETFLHWVKERAK